MHLLFIYLCNDTICYNSHALYASTVHQQHTVRVLHHCGQVLASANRNPHSRERNPFENRFSNIITLKLSRLDESSNLKCFRQRNNKPLNLQLGNPSCPSL